MSKKRRTIFTINQIKLAWTEYRNKKFCARLKEGKWLYEPMRPGLLAGPIDGTRAELKSAYDVMGFPEFLEKYYEEKK